jgi:hypothetical protein
VVESSNTTAISAQNEKITLLAKSSSGGRPYKVEFLANGPSVMVQCHCLAGRRKWMCKHKLALITGDSNMLFDPSQAEHLSRIQSWPQYSDLKNRMEVYFKRLREIDEAADAENQEYGDWMITREVNKHLSRGEEVPSFFVFVGVDDDSEAQEKFAKHMEALDELRAKEKAVKEDFMRGLTSGYHRI